MFSVAALLEVTEPVPGLYRHAAAVMGRAPVVDDLAVNLLGARRIGRRATYLTARWLLSSLVHEHPDIGGIVSHESRIRGNSAGCGAVVWLTGPFGAGKSSVAEELVARGSAQSLLGPGWRLFDPEYVGFALRAQLPDLGFTDFQELVSWRRLVPIVADEVVRETGQNLIVVQTVLHHGYWRELVAGFAALGYAPRMVLLDADEHALRRQIVEDEVLHRAAGWRLQHVPRYLTARDAWMRDAADLVVETTSIGPRQAAE
ncbi:AAA family ATPase [Nocardia carnea]|uniref:AAA family ATPase n=1 Tax=Nocardia carnea TaxID=37328 RepID=UPI00245791FF|nr:AAA family ATPase [Nocardia carnea]